MANGIEDLMNIRTTGGTQNVPPGPPMGGPPQPQPQPQPMGPPPMGPPMGGGIASMGGGQPPMGPPPGMGGGQPPMEESVSIEQDAAMLAEATMGRTGGDPEASLAILQTAAEMIMSVGQEGPMMGGGGQEPILASNGGPLYAQEGKPITGEETLKQMIMDNLILNSEGVNSISPLGYNTSGRTLSDRDSSGRTLSDRDSSGRTLSDADLLTAAYDAAAANSPTGRTTSDEDVSIFDEGWSALKDYINYHSLEEFKKRREERFKTMDMVRNRNKPTDPTEQLSKTVPAALGIETPSKSFSSLLKDLHKQDVFDSLVSSRGVLPPKIK